MKKITSAAMCITSLLLSGCTSENEEENKESNSTLELTCKEKLSQLELEIHNDLDTITTDTEFTLTIKTKSGRSFTHSTGTSTADTLYKSASTSKMVTAAVILDLVNQGILSLDDTPNKYIESWSQSGNLSNIKLRDLLSFTSGLSNAPLCNFDGSADFEECVDKITFWNSNSAISASEYYYGPNHLQVAGLMAMKATNTSDWNSLFNRFKEKYKLFTLSTYDLPSATNPKLAGGMHWTANEYLAFLEKLYNNEILSETLSTQMSSDQIATATIVESPALNSINEDWHYGFGVWIESKSNPFDKAKVTGRVSSPGLYGAYPFMDYTHNYYGILAREGGLSTFEKGYALFTSVESKLEQWADTTCN